MVFIFDINSKNKKIFFLFIEIGGLFILLIQILFPKIFFIPWGNNFIIFGFILFLFGVVFSTWSRLFFVCPALIAVVIIIAKKEECLLGQYFGKPYQEYRKKVSFLLFY